MVKAPHQPHLDAAARRAYGHWAAVGQHRQSAERWAAWIQRTRATLAEVALQPAPEDVRHFQVHNFAGHQPTKISLPDWPAFAWTFDALKRRIGGAPVEVQSDRCTNPEYEMNTMSHRRTMPFDDLIDAITDGPANNTYLTGQNNSRSAQTLYPLFEDLKPLPPFLGQWQDPVFWMGGATVTPLHHDLVQILLCQIIGRKLVRLVHPMQTPLLGRREGVFASDIKWLDDETATSRGIAVLDYEIGPGEGVFLPVGFWHCVKSCGPSVSAAFTHFPWQSRFENNFPS